jgi:hypothetical protein
VSLALCLSKGRCDIYLWAMKQEDYGTCAVAKELLFERGYNNISPTKRNFIFTNGLTGI